MEIKSPRIPALLLWIFISTSVIVAGCVHFPDKKSNPFNSQETKGAVQVNNHEIPEKIMAPNRAKTRFGPLEYFDGVPTEEPVRSLYDEEAYLLAGGEPLKYQFPSPLLLDQADTKDKDAGPSKSPPKEGGYTQEQINEMINNPLGELWLLFMQNDYTSYDGDALDFLGEDDKIFNTTVLQPVVPFQFTENWKYIFRPVIPFHYWDVPSLSAGTPTFYPGGTLPAQVDWDREFNMGDIVLWNAFATNEMVKPPNIYGVGLTAMLPTATDDTFGTGKWSVGPMGLAFHVGPPGGFIYGVVAQQWWDVAGSSNRDHVNMSNIQYVGYYRLDAETNIGFGPNIVIDWTADNDNRWTVPVGLGINRTIKIGKLPVKVGVEYYRYLKTPDNFGPEWTIRFIFSPVIPKPGFSKDPIF